MNDLKCKDCKKYFELMKPRRGRNGGMLSLNKGHCLAQTIYASNRVGNEVHPPGSRMEVRPDGRHLIVIVRGEEVKPHCSSATKR